MADQSIRKDFVEGVQEIFTTLFNNGDEGTDVLFFYPLSDSNTTNIYGESKYKIYNNPILLVCKATLSPTQGDQSVETVTDQAEFVVTLKSLQENGLDTSNNGLEEMRRGIIKFHNAFYLIDNIIPKAYVEDVFLMYRFLCTELIDSIAIITDKDAAESIDKDAIEEVVVKYLDEHPVTIDETDPTVPAWAKQPTKPSYTAEEVGALSTSTLSDAIDTALAEAKALNVQNANDIVTIRADLDKKADGIESLYKDGILRVSITSGNERIEHRITDIIYPNKSFDLTGSIVDSQYSNGLARINLTDGIDLDNIVLSAFARAGNGSTTFCIYDNDDTLLFVGSNINLGIPTNNSNKFIKDFTIPRSVIPDNASYMLVSFWKNTAITWEHPFIKYAVNQKEVIASSNVTIPTSEKAEYVGTEHFKITINKNVLPESGIAVEEYEDDGVIFLPSSYTKSGKPTRLVISCHGSGTVINENFNRESKSWNNFLITMGYAVLDVNGGVADSRHYNAPFAIQSYIKAYQYVVDKYNLYKEVFVLGASMGGLPAFTLAQLKTIPVKAVAGFCPVVDLYRQAWCQPWYNEDGDFSIQRKRIANCFGFDNGFSEWTTHQVPSTAEKQYFLDNIEKVKGYYPMLFGTINADKILTIDDGDYNGLVRITNVPTKIIQPDTDPTVSAVYGKYLISAIKNGGGIAEHKSYLSGGHTPSWGGITTFDGVQCYDSEAELVKWFRRWE